MDNQKNTLKTLIVLATLPIALFLLMSDETARMYWPYILISYIIASIHHVQKNRKATKAQPKTNILQYLFPKRIWLHPSAINDYIIIIINYAIFLTVFHAFVITPETVQRFISTALENTSITQSTHTPTFGALALYTLSSFMLSDLFYYISHRISHEVPALWELHKVHHSAKVLTPATLHRAHPFDIWFNVCFRSAGLGIASAVFYSFYPSTEGFITIAGVNAGVFVSYILLSNLRHSHIWISFGPALEHIFMSPSQHQIHHSEKPEHFDKNYGSFFCIWDWAFKSLYVTRGYEKLTFGLGNEKEEAPLSTASGLYINPVINAWRKLR